MQPASMLAPCCLGDAARRADATNGTLDQEA